MKNVTVVYVCFVIISVATLAATARRGRQSSHYLGSSASSSRLSFVKTFDAYVYCLNDGYGNCGTVHKALSPQPGQMSLKALNPENAELHPETLSHVESTISKEREAELRRLGIIEGDSNTWRNWHIMTQGQWPDIGQQKQPPSDPDAPITELYALRKPLEYWGFMRGIDDNISSYPIMWEYYKDTYGKVDVAEHGGSNPLYSPMLYRPSWDIEKDRGGLGYNDARLFRGWVGLDLDLPTKVKTASDLIMIPDTGRLYQKFYMGPYPITMGWTLGSLLKVLALSRSPGHGVVAVKVHNMNEDTTIDGVADDLMNIALNLNEVALETLEPGGEARVRTVIKGPAQVCAGSIEWPSFVKIATPDAYITNVEEGGTLDIELKIEWGRGLWLADYKGLYRHEDAADAVCMRRRRIKEVDEEDFHPITTFFGGCRMVRLAVHKLIGERWDLITSSCPDPREQLVVEVWTDRSTTPKAALEFGLSESIAWIRELKRQLIQDADFDGEDEQLRDTWEKIDKYKSLQQRQQMMGGPPTYNLHDTNAIPGLKESDCQYVGSVDDVKLVPQAPYSLPQIPPPRPQQDSLEWLATELQSEDYDDASPINSRSFEKFLPQPKDRATDVDLSILPVSQEVISSLRLCGFNTVHDIIQITENKLEDYPGITSKDAKVILDFINSNILMKTG